MKKSEAEALAKKVDAIAHAQTPAKEAKEKPARTWRKIGQKGLIAKLAEANAAVERARLALACATDHKSEILAALETAIAENNALLAAAKAGA